jgi:hypothetical protein
MNRRDHCILYLLSESGKARTVFQVSWFDSEQVKRSKKKFANTVRINLTRPVSEFCCSSIYDHMCRYICHRKSRGSCTAQLMSLSYEEATRTRGISRHVLFGISLSSPIIGSAFLSFVFPSIPSNGLFGSVGFRKLEQKKNMTKLYRILILPHSNE